jgi:hypothetical protein
MLPWIALVAAFSSAMSIVATAAEVPEVPKAWTFTFPEGNPAAGKVVFMRMECYSCHAINLPGENLPADSGGIGPALTPGYSKLPAAYLAESVIKAHTVVAAPGYELKAGQAGMGKYNHFLTVQELIDLVAFLEHLPGPTTR